MKPMRRGERQPARIDRCGDRADNGANRATRGPSRIPRGLRSGSFGHSLMLGDEGIREEFTFRQTAMSDKIIMRGLDH